MQNKNLKLLINRNNLCMQIINILLNNNILIKRVLIFKEKAKIIYINKVVLQQIINNFKC